MEEKLEWMDREYLSHYDAVKVDSEVPEQKPFEQDVYKTAWYGISEEETEENSAYLSWNKVTGSVLDPKRYMAFQVLEYALLGAPGAPLKKALTDAEIGRDIYGGYDSSMRQTSFSVVAKGADADRLEEFLQIIRGTLEQLAEQGIRKKSLLAGINHCEFKCREADFGSYPKGLMYGIQCFDSWLYDDSAPLMHLKYEDTFRFLREQVDTGYFEGLIREYLLDNPHGGVCYAASEKGIHGTAGSRGGKTPRRLSEISEQPGIRAAGEGYGRTARLPGRTVHRRGIENCANAAGFRYREKGCGIS